MVIVKISGSGQATKSALRPSSVEESATMGVTSIAYFSDISFAALRSRSSRLALIKSSTPASASRSAVALPMPALPPATSAFLPLI